MAYTAGWADLPLDLLDGVITRLPFPGDRARLAAVCRAWRSAVRQLASNLPWIVLPSGAFCTAGNNAVRYRREEAIRKKQATAAADHDEFFHSIPGLPKNVTCVGATDAWLALDVTDDVFRRTPYWDHYCPDTGTFSDDSLPRADVRHKHAYLLYNPFSNATVPLPGLDAIVGHVAETLEIRKVLMRSSPDDVIAVTTNSCNYNIILCRPGKKGSTFVLDDYRVIDVAFLGDTLYGVTSGEELLAFHLANDGEDGSPSVARIELVIKNSLARYYYDEFPWSWPQHVVDISDGDEEGNNNNNNGDEELVSSSSSGDEDEDDDDEAQNQEGQEVDGNDEELDDDDDSYYGDGGTVSDNDVFVGLDEEVTYEPKDQMFVARYLVRSSWSGGELLLLVRHQHQSPPFSASYTRKVDIFKADLSWGKWDAFNGLAKGEALFLSRSFSKCTRAWGDIREGFMYYTRHLDEVFDTKSWTTHRMLVKWPWQCRRESHEFLTWLFPPELVV